MKSPVKIEVQNKENLYILWNDNSETKIPLKKLRDACPCAECASKKDKKVEYKEAFPTLNIGGKYEIIKMEIVGNYAVNIFWKDGHSTGIYEFKYLQELGE